MEPKEKAKELVGKYTPLASSGGYYDDRSYNVGTDKEVNAKQCALIAVDELLSIAENFGVDRYWQEVKEELEKL